MNIRRLALVLTMAFGKLLVNQGQAQQEDNPAYYDIEVTAKVYVPYGAYNGGGYLSFNDETGASIGGTVGGPHGQTYTIGPQWANVVPGKDYVATVQYGTYSTEMDIELICPVPNYKFRINGELTNHIKYVGSGHTSFTFRLEYNGSYPLDSAPTGLAGGQSSQIVSDKPIWYVGLGSMRNGESAGAIGFRKPDFNASNFFTRSILVCDNRDPSEVYIARPSGYIEQVFSREVLINVETVSSTSYRLKVYPRAQVGSKVGNYYTVSGLPFATYTVSKFTPSGGTGVKIVKEENGSDTLETKLQLVGNVWTHWPWAKQSSSLARYITTNQTSSTSSTVSHSGTNAEGTAIETPLVWTKTFTQHSWGKELDEVTYGSGSDLKDESGYKYSNTTGSGKISGYLEWETRSDGSWSRYEYYTTSGTSGDKGMIKRVYMPWKDGAASPTSATTSNSVYEDWSYKIDVSGNYVLPASRIRRAPGGSIISKTTWSYSLSNSPSRNGKSVSRVERTDHASGSQSVKTTTRKFRKSLDRYFSEKPVSVSRADGSFDSYAYFNGTWNETTRSFTASSTGDDRQVMVFHGQSSGGTSVPSVTLNGQTWYMDPVGMVANRSMISVTVVDKRGKVVFKGKEIFVNTSTRHRIEGIVYDYDGHGRLVKETDVMRSDSSADFAKYYDYEGSLLTKVTDFDGIETVHEYDSLLRRVETRRGENYSSSEFPEKVEITKYDGASRPVETYDCDCGTSPKLIGYDTAGRVLYESLASPNPSEDLTTSFNYQTVTKTTVTQPHGGSVITEHYLDGRPKSVSGDTSNPKSYDYTANSTGVLVTVHNGTNNTNGWVEEQRDWLGRVVSRTVPAYGWASDSNKKVTYEYHYNSAGQLWKERVKYDKTDQYIRADKVYEYDSDGTLLEEGLDLGTNNSLDASSNDRYVRYSRTFTDNPTVGWMGIEESTVYPISGASTSKRLQHYNYRLETEHTSFGFLYNPDQALDVTDSYVATYSYLDSAKKEREDYTLTKGSVWRFDEYRNGYLYQSNGDAGEKTRISYDSLGRQIMVQGRWDGDGSVFAETTNLTYYGNTNFVHTSETGGITVTYGYQWNPTQGTRTEIVTDELGKKTYTLYDEKGQVWRVWGSAVQPVEYEYDDVGRLLHMRTYRSGSFTGPSWPTSGIVAATTTWDWEEATGLLLSKSSADAESVTFTYKPLGEVHTKTLARGAVATYSYYDESAGTSVGDVSHLTRELRQIDYTNDSDLTPSVRYTYNRLGQIATVVTDFDGDGLFEEGETRTLTYRSDMQLESESLESTVFGSGRSLVSTYEVDGSGTVKGRGNGYQFKSGAAVQASATYGFDGFNRLVTAAPLGGQAMHLAYTPGSSWVGQVTAGPSESAKYVRMNSLLSNRSVVDQVNTAWNGSSRGSYDSNFDTQRGLRSSLVQSGASSSSSVITNFTTTFSYNDRRELVDADNSYSSNRDYEWSYDLMGKRTSAKVDTSTTSYNAVSNASTDVNEYASITGTNAESGLLYDDDGNMLRDGDWEYVYDAENRLVKMTRKTESSGGTVADRLEFKYDYLGRRVQKTVYNHRTSGSLLSKTSFVWNGWSLVAELNAASSHSLLLSYLWGPDFSTTSGQAGGAGGLLSVTQGTAVYYPVYDPMGNVTGYVTDNTSGTGNGAIAARYEYNAYGERQNGSGNENGFAFGFATQYTDRETGLVYYGMRYYNPKHGRFINRDPIGENGGLNLYSFVGNNPAMRHDVLGLQCVIGPDDYVVKNPEDGTFAVLWGSEEAKAACDAEAARTGNLVTDNKIVDSYINDPMIQAIFQEQQKYLGLPVFELDASGSPVEGSLARSNYEDLHGLDISGANMPGNGVIGQADKGQSQYLNPADRDKIYNQALGVVQSRLPGLVNTVTGNSLVEIRTNTIFRRGSSAIYPEAVYRDNGKIVVDLTINGNTSVEFVEAMIVHGFTHAVQHISGMRVHNEYDAYKAQWAYETKYHSTVLPVFGKYLDSSGNFLPESNFNTSHQARTGQKPNTAVKVRAPYIVR